MKVASDRIALPDKAGRVMKNSRVAQNTLIERPGGEGIGVPGQRSRHTRNDLMASDLNTLSEEIIVFLPELLDALVPRLRAPDTLVELDRRTPQLSK